MRFKIRICGSVPRIVLLFLRGIVSKSCWFWNGPNWNSIVVCELWLLWMENWRSPRTRRVPFVNFNLLSLPRPVFRKILLCSLMNINEIIRGIFLTKINLNRTNFVSVFRAAPRSNVEAFANLFKPSLVKSRQLSYKIDQRFHIECVFLNLKHLPKW